MRLTRQGPAPPPGGADDIEHVMLEGEGVVVLLPPVLAHPHIGDLLPVDVQGERGMTKPK